MRRLFPSLYCGAEKLKIICDAVMSYSIQHRGTFTSTDLSEFIMRTYGVQITPSAIGIVLKRLKFVDKVAPKTYTIRNHRNTAIPR